MKDDGRCLERIAHPSSDSSMLYKNLVVGSMDNVTDIGFLPATDEVIGEFIGLVHFGPSVSAMVHDFLENEFPKQVGGPFEQSGDIRMAYLTDLFRHL